jgi:DNA-directed RNA polymerase subunit RPC12/RpoP
VEVKSAGDLMYFTYFMVDWAKVKQSDSDIPCTTCGGKMMVGDRAVDLKGNKYDCYVCHVDKRVVWVKVP